MRQILAAIITTLSLAFAAAPQGDAPKAKVSAAALTEEQIVVYRAVLSGYSNGSNEMLNVADKTETLDLSEEKDCLKGIDLESGNTSASVIHKLDDRVINAKKDVVLVDGELQQKRIEENDPQKLMKRAIDDGERVTEKRMDDSLHQAFAAGLFTFSEIGV
ncbi:MAG TPA: hypothetical protein VJN89_16315 [Candidatus Acidoferrum sp.]|nr:hypothetical protein [Candidatus Acidoferrum sp.]